MSNFAFRMMSAAFVVLDLFRSSLDNRVRTFGLSKGMTVVDYGCGPGRYTIPFATAVGPIGRVIAVDIQPLAIEAVQKKARDEGIENVETSQAQGYDSGLPTGVADVICALDMFFGVSDPSAFLAELHRILKPEGTLVLDDGHQSRAKTKEKLAASGLWRIQEETSDHLKCRPKPLAQGEEDEAVSGNETV